MAQLRNLIGRSVLLLAGGMVDGLVGVAQAGDPCVNFKWNLAHEHALFGGEASEIQAGHDPASAPQLSADRLYAVALSAQEEVKYSLPPAKKMLSDGAYGGDLSFRVAAAGHYRVSLGAPFWIDVIAAGKALEAVDFGGSPGCDSPHKVVEYELPADAPLILQLSGQTAPKVRLTITAVKRLQ